MPKLVANVKWIGGEDDGKVTVGVPTDCIMNFNHQEYLSENFDPDESFVIEWREPGRKPAGGWPKFDGLVFDVAATIQALERKSVNYVYAKSPRVVTPRTESGKHSHVESKGHASGSAITRRYSETPINSRKSKKQKPNSHQDICSSSDENVSDDEEVWSERTPLSALDQNTSQKSTKKREASTTPNDEVIDEGEHQNPLEPIIEISTGELSPRNAAVRGNDESLNGRDRPNVPNPITRELNPEDVIPDVINRQELLEIRDLLRQTVRNQKQAGEDEGPESVELGKKGSGVMLPILQWEVAKEQKTFTSMATCLVMSLFDHETLLNSNVKGGKSKINKPPDNAPRRRALDPNILNAIAVTVKKEFPRHFKRTEMHTAINVKLCRVRKENRVNVEAAAAAARANVGI